MKAEILKRERLANGWYRFKGAVNGITSVQGKEVGVRLPTAYVESVSESEAESEVKEALCAEYDRLTRGNGGAYARG